MFVLIIINCLQHFNNWLMNQKDSHQKKLQEIYENKSFERLGRYTQNNFWQGLETADKQLLAELLLIQGEQLLLDGDERAFDVFAKASEITPEDPHLHYLQGVLLSGVKESPLHFFHACESFARATAIDPERFEAWFCWGKAMLQQAEEREDEEMAEQAEALFAKAANCRPDDSQLEASLYWNWGMVDCFLGRLHGEAVDFKKAIKKFAVAASLGFECADFWEHYGHVICELGSLVNTPEALLEGRKYFERALKVNSESGSAWLSLAFCDQKIYEVFAKDEDFVRGIESFEAAEQYNDKDPQFWYRFGLLLFLFGRLTFDVSKILDSFDKFKLAHEGQPDNHVILGKWAEAEMVYGIYSDRIDYLRQAEARIVNSLKLQDDNPEIWYIYGTCLNEMGRYFSEGSYYQQAIEKFQYGLYLAPQDPIMSQGISLSYYSLGEMKNDSSLIELSIIYSEKAVQNSKVAVPQFFNDWGVSLMKLAEITADKVYLEAAIEKFEASLADFNEDAPDSFDPEWLYNYGCALDFLGDFHEDPHYYEKAVQVLTKFLQFDPTYLHAHYNLASAYSHLGELVGDVDCFHKAIDHFQRFLSEDNEDEMVWNDFGLTLLNLADLLHDPSLPNLSQVCFAQAEEKFLRAVSLGNSSAFYNLGCLYSLMECFPQALHYMEKAEQQRALPPLEEIMEDEWLENLHQTEGFRLFLANLSLRRLDNR